MMMANSFHSIISEMETSFLKIFTNAAAKMADLTESKVFIVFESSDGSRQIGGNQELVTSFQSGYLLPQPTDEVIGETTYQFQPKMNSESHRTSNSDHRIVVSYHFSVSYHIIYTYHFSKLSFYLAGYPS